MKEEKILNPFLYLFKSKKNRYLAYNGINNSFMKLNEPLFMLLNRAIASPSLLSELDSDTFLNLENSNVICTEKQINNYLYQKRFLKSYSTFQHDFLNLTIAPTTKCNFTCPYCYEKGIKGVTITDPLITDLLDFIEERSKQTKNAVRITWYGGEPLLSVNKIIKIMDGLKDRKIDILENSIITNGYYLTKKNLDILIKYGIQFIQITLDGASAESHNRRRFMKNKGSWDTILKNIDDFVAGDDQLIISIRCNIDTKNQEEYKVLKGNLTERWKNDKRIYIYPAILRDHSTEENLECQYFSNEEGGNYLLTQQIREKNIPYFKYNIGGCSANQFNAYLIGPEGELYKCWNDLGKTEKIVGYINDKSSINKNMLFSYLSGPSQFDDAKCTKCCLFFVCDGGCQWQRLRNENLDKKNSLCHFAKAHIEKYLEGYYQIKKEINDQVPQQ